MSLRQVLCCIIALAILSAPIAFADVPQLINYQGRLTSGGSAVTTPANVIFAIWNADVDGDSLWSEQHTITPDGNGSFITLLGSVAPIPDSAFVGDAYLSIQVESNPEMTPRAQLVSVAYSYRVGTIQGATGGGLTGELILTNPEGDSTVIGPDLIVIRGAGGDEDEVYCSASGITITDQNGDVRINISIDEDGPGITLYESATSMQKGNQDTGGRKVEFREGGVLLYGASDADTVCHLLPDGSIIGRGQLTMGTNNSADGQWANVLGYYNSADGDSATVSGGFSNAANGYGSTVSGGARNIADSAYCTVGGGTGNYAGGTLYGGATVGGGALNFATGDFSTVAGGYNDTASGDWAAVGGGSTNEATGDVSFVGGGYDNQADGFCSTIPGGYRCVASGDYSFATGRWVTAGPANNTMVLGSGVSNVNYLTNNTQNSLVVGFNTTTPTFFVGGNNHRVGVLTTSPSYELDVNGDIGCVTLHESSDERLKTNISQLEGVLDKLGEIRGVSFEWNETAATVGGIPGQKQIGVLAQEVEMVFPELVSEREDGFKSVDYTKLTAVLVEAIKDLKIENETLQESVREIDGLQRELAEVKSLLQKLLTDGH